ncbi:hypothetical protein PG994_003157 [Apiospora phragmitis]|uniref:Hydantoinase B/oxoprolinase domain-containing protein n=1 Tax=Apiospora phragmitis TaxID=2905665 RepID=A0ABR1W780_9PEZI
MRPVPVHLQHVATPSSTSTIYTWENCDEGDVLVSIHSQAAVLIRQTICSTGPRGHHLDIGGYWKVYASGFDHALAGGCRNQVLLPGATATSMRPGSSRSSSSRAASQSQRLLTVGDNLSDLKAQVAANAKAARSSTRLMAEYGSARCTSTCARDYLDNGSMMQVAITVDETGFGTFDFTGIVRDAVQHERAARHHLLGAHLHPAPDSSNPTFRSTRAALVLTKVILPKNSFLNPSAGPVWLLRASPQGFFKREGVHMTNTRTTDVEIIEKRYPVLLREFSICRGSGGRGQFSGGDGVVRDWELPWCR